MLARPTVSQTTPIRRSSPSADGARPHSLAAAATALVAAAGSVLGVAVAGALLLLAYGVGVAAHDPIAVLGGAALVGFLGGGYRGARWVLGREAPEPAPTPTSAASREALDRPSS